jgi:hypothetical protein
MQAVKGLSMDKWLCWSAMGVSGLFALLFVLDLLFAWLDVPFQPFGGLYQGADVLGVLCSALLLYLSWSAWRELR